MQHSLRVVTWNMAGGPPRGPGATRASANRYVAADEWLADPPPSDHDAVVVDHCWSGDPDSAFVGPR